MPIKMVLPALVELLPLKEDYEENEPVWGMIVRLCKLSLPIPPLVIPSFLALTTLSHQDSASEPTILSLTPQLLPILNQVLSPPDEQLSDATRSQLVEMVKYVHGKYPSEVKKYERLTEVARS